MTQLASSRPVSLSSVTRPTTWQDPIALFASAHGEADRALWLRPSTGEACVGLGSARSFGAHGSDRFSRVARDWRALVEGARVEDASRGQSGPRLLGGFSFDPLKPPTELWKAFANASMVLPRRMLSLRDGSAWLTSNTAAAACEPLTMFGSRSVEPPTLSPREWKALTGRLVHDMRSGQLPVEKVVLARAHHVRASEPFCLERVLRRLVTRYPSCTIFAVARGEACFLGATPERLIELHHGYAATMALAGSAPRGHTPRQDRQLAERLLHDSKERAEHAVVVAALREALGRLSTRVIADAEPRVEQLANVQHLLTPIRAQLPHGTGVLDLVERLHPTPAVGGFPREAALEIIRSEEQLDRGWYASPLGWVDANGDGEFVVGLRAALVHGNEATLYAGCGIIAESDPDTELAESGWKLRPMLAALGLEDTPAA
jgi:menaquinone-specific isochorismate synthase